MFGNVFGTGEKFMFGYWEYWGLSFPKSLGEGSKFAPYYLKMNNFSSVNLFGVRYPYHQ